MICAGLAFVPLPQAESLRNAFSNFILCNSSVTINPNPTLIHDCFVLLI
jgi:hypothetical protein